MPRKATGVRKVKSLVTKRFGERLRACRETNGYDTAKEFAEELGIPQNTYTRYERGETEPDFQLLLRMCQILNTTPDFLLRGGKRNAPIAARRKSA